MGDGEKIQEGTNAEKRQTISLCMIVKDERENLPRCLKNMKAAVDEIVVVDTGSADGTQAIALALGAVLHEYSWDNNYSNARNYSLRKANGDWALILDADEAIDSVDLPRIRGLVSGGRADGYAITTRNYGDWDFVAGWKECKGEYPEMERGHRGWFPSKKVRLFRRSPPYCFEGEIHETVDGSILRAGGGVEDCDLCVHHFGSADKDKRSKKIANYIEIARNKVSSNPLDPRARLELGLHLFDLGRMEEAELQFRSAIELQKKAADLVDGVPADKFTDAHNMLACLMIFQKRYKEAVDTLKEALHIVPDCCAAHNNLGIAYREMGLVDAARYHFGEAVRNNGGNAQALRNLEKLASRRGVDRKKISICMIVKDEEHNIGDCIKSFAPLAFEFVVLDTGSIDMTAEIARSLGAGVFYALWRNDFSAARNESLRYAIGDYILWVDADDRLEQGAAEKIKSVIERSNGAAIAFKVVSIGAGGQKVSAYQIRAFPNGAGVVFEGAVHEQVANSIARLGMQCVYSDAQILHLGYASQSQREQKLKRNLGILEAILKVQPSDKYSRYIYALTCLEAGQKGRAKADLERVLQELTEMEEGQPWSLHAHVALAQCCMEAGEIEPAKALLIKAAHADNTFWLANFVLGQLHFKCGDYELAYEQFLKTAPYGPREINLPLDVDEARYFFHLYFGRCKQMRRDYTGAIADCKSALAIKPAELEPRYWLVDLLIEAREYGLAETEIKKLLAEGTADGLAYFQAGVVALHMGKYDGAVDRFDSAIKAGFDGAEIRSNYGLALSRVGRHEAAKDEYRKALRSNPACLDALLNLGHLCLKNREYGEAKRAFASAILWEDSCLDAHLATGLMAGMELDLDSCARSCDNVLRLLGMKRSYTVESFEDMGELFAKAGDELVSRDKKQEASLAYDAALALHPGFSPFLKKAASLSFEIGDYEKGIKLYNDALIANPKDGEVYCELASWFENLGSFEEAKICYDKAVQADENCARAREKLLLIGEKFGRR